MHIDQLLMFFALTFNFLKSQVPVPECIYDFVVIVLSKMSLAICSLILN